MANNEQVKQYIQKLVKEEVRKLLPLVIKETFGAMISEAIETVPTKTIPRRPIREEVEAEFEEYPTMTGKTFDRSRMTELMGYGSTSQPGTTNRKSASLITVDAAMSEQEHGNPRPIDPNSIPDYLIQAFNKDYTPFMKSVEAKKLHG